MVTGLFRDPESADRAYRSALDRGYDRDQVSLLMSDETRKKHFKDGEHGDSELGNKALEGAGVGGALGATVGGIAGAIAAAAAPVVFPGIGIVLSGPLAAALAGAGAGGVGGGLIGALIGAGIPEDRAKAYEPGLKEGGIVLGLEPRNEDDADYFAREWTSNRGEQVYR